MTQYIDKSVIVAEIERRMYELHPTNTHQMQVGEKIDRDVLMCLNVLTWVKNFLNIFEVKEVDLEKEISNYMNNHHLYIKDGGRIVFCNNVKVLFMSGRMQTDNLLVF